MKFIFENKELKLFRNCSDTEIRQIIDGFKDGRTMHLSMEGKFEKRVMEGCTFYGCYRVLAPVPTPNEVDWSQMPGEYRYVFTVSKGESFASNLLPGQVFGMSTPPDIASLERSTLRPAMSLRMTDGENGFKRGTVESKDSLLVRPVGV